MQKIVRNISEALILVLLKIELYHHNSIAPVPGYAIIYILLAIFLIKL